MTSEFAIQQIDLDSVAISQGIIHGFASMGSLIPMAIFKLWDLFRSFPISELTNNFF
jgi:hypothetical protein